MISDIGIYDWVSKNWKKLCERSQTYNGKARTSIADQIARRFCIPYSDAVNIVRSVAIWKGINR